MAAPRLAEWVRCPNCLRGLEPAGERALGCDHGHRFDLNRRGFITLLAPRAPAVLGDDRAMLEARDRVLGDGLYDPIVRAVVDAAVPALPVGGRVVDLGCGTGHYGRAVQTTVPDARLLAADRSPEAVRWATRSPSTADGVVLDLWRPLPLRDAIADVALDVFAPRNPGEFARIVRPDGRLVVVVPNETHLDELRARGGMLEVPAGKAAAVTAQFAEGFEPVSGETVRYRVRVDELQAADVIGMGPAARHRGGDSVPATREGWPLDVTVDVTVLALRRAG